MSHKVDEQRPLNIIKALHPLVDIWIVREDEDGANYYYGGTRLVNPEMNDSQVIGVLSNLARCESGLKNKLINKAIASGALSEVNDRLPAGFGASKVAGGRCVIRPKTHGTASVLEYPDSTDFLPMARDIFATIGDILNQESGRIKLTPDFGRFMGVADILAEYTPNVLGIKCELGGCGGKSSYAATGILEAIELLGKEDTINGPVTLIGSAGALGSAVLDYFLQRGSEDLAVCDLVYDGATKLESAPQATLLPAIYGKFTDECLSRGGLIVATTIGYELENSAWELIPPGTLLLLAHNCAIPTGSKGISLTRGIAERGVLSIPGQVLTLGGALTARLEWFWRQSNPGEPFDKPLAHNVVKLVVRFCLDQINKDMASTGVTPYEAMWRLAADGDGAV